MGNRAVICHESVTKENKDKKMGIYLHWNGSPEDVKQMLDNVKGKIRSYSGDPTYCMARLCQSMANDISNGEVIDSSIGIGLITQLNCRNYDNGVYYFNDQFDIVKHTTGAELED